MNKLANHTALKEWSSVIDALGRGDHVILIRKGGLADPKFGLEADRFYLYPTFFHTQQSEPDHVTISHWCEVVGTWCVDDLDALLALQPLVVMPAEVLETRYKFRPDQALHVIGVRTYELARPHEIAVRPDYLGCRSWVSIDDEIDIDRSRAVLTDPTLAKRLDAVQVLLPNSTKSHVATAT